MTGIVKTDQIQGAGSSTVTIPSGTALNVTNVSGTPTFSGASTFSGDVTLPSINGGQIGGRRNMVINGAMQVAQRGTSGFTTNAAYTLDRYKVFCPAASFTVSQSTTAPTDFYHSIKIENTSTATPSSSQGGNIFTFLEGNTVSQLNWGTPNAKAATLSFYVRANNAGTYCVSLENANGTVGSGSHSFVTEYTISSANTWEEKKIVIPGPTVGTWKTDNSLGIVIGWTLQVGSNFETSTADAWQSGLFRQTSNQINWQQTASADFHLTGIQLEVGSQATAFEHRSFGEELQLCKRYFERMFRGGSAPSGTERTGLGAGVWYQNSQVLAHLGFSTKRAAPTVTQSETGAIGCYGSGFFRTSTDSTPFDSITHNSLRINITSFNSNGTQGNGTYVQLVTNNVSNISIDAEL